MSLRGCMEGKYIYVTVSEKRGNFEQNKNFEFLVSHCDNEINISFGSKDICT